MNLPATWMARALQLARQGLYTTDPNPRVGCVLVNQGKLVGEGYHQRAGEPHAEIHALRQAGSDARGATAYVTLEPCAHHGRTGPCSQALIEAGVVEVIAAMQDPNLQVAGQGFAQLQAAGVVVQWGLLEKEARALNPGFISRMSRGRPYVRLKMAMSLDGRTAMRSGESQWITGPAARTQVQRLRARSSAVVSGVESIIIDDSRLTVRAEQLQLDEAESIATRQPLRVILDSQLRLPHGAACLQEPGRTLVVTCQQDRARHQALIDAGVEIAMLPEDKNGRVNLTALMKYLASVEQVNELLLETGATLAGAMLEAELLDEMQLFLAPTLLGGNARPLFAIPGLEKMTQRRGLEIVDIRAVGEDWRIIAKPKPHEADGVDFL